MSPAGEVSTIDPLVVTEFRVVRADSSLGGSISQPVRTNLERSSAIRVVPQTTVADALQRTLKPPTVRLDLPL